MLRRKGKGEIFFSWGEVPWFYGIRSISNAVPYENKFLGATVFAVKKIDDLLVKLNG